MTPPDNNAPDPEFEQIQKEYKNAIPKKLNDLRQLIKAVQNSVTPETLGALRFAIHKLAGNAGTFGYMEVSAICRLLDKDIAQKIEELPRGTPNIKWVSELDLHFQRIKEAFLAPH